MNEFEIFSELIETNNNFIITTHVNPDGDAIGSELAIARYLKSIGKQVNIINHSYTPEFLLFMLKVENEIEIFKRDYHSELIKQADVIIVLDLNQLSRTGDLSEFFKSSKAKKVCIDHHDFPENFADVEIFNTDKSSTGELVYDFLSTTELEINYDIALPIYVAILTDTGSFKYDRTTPRVHRIVAELLETGIETKTVYREVYDQGSANRIKLLGRALSSLTLFCDGKASYMKVTKSDLKETETKEEDVEGFVNYNLTIKGVEVGIFFFELDEGVKVSFRSVSKVPVNKLAKEFGGGGHFHAAGARFKEKDLGKVIYQVIQTTEKYISEFL